jgi:acetyltransferase-like isoleucine patch superfamily enzyme
MVNKLTLEANTRIGHFNFIKIDSLDFSQAAYIGHLNIIRGPFSINFAKSSSVGNSNIISRAKKGITYGDAVLNLGELAKITARHSVDLTRSVSIGDFSTIAGAGSQIWTHGYIHAPNGSERIRVDGEIKIMNNVYIGSKCILNAGVTINKAITVGSNSTISKDLIEPGMYVGQKLRFIEKDIEAVKSALSKVEVPNLLEDVYEK